MGKSVDDEGVPLPDPRVVDGGAPAVPVSRSLMRGWVTDGRLVVHVLPASTRAQPAYHGRRLALFRDIERLAAGQTVEPSVAPTGSYRCVYGVELKAPCSRQEHADRPCLYVGETGLKPRERLIQHLADIFLGVAR
jgi:hypothetical protein